MTPLRHKRATWFILLLFFHLACSVDNKEEDLMESETKDPTQVEIVKQIKRFNDDGSYTYGYEADDGSFKIESRDVLGNIKGTFGYVDDDGAIKRVSYSTSNSSSSEVTSTPTPTLAVRPIQRFNRTRRPSSVVFKHVVTTPSTPTSTSVIQPIPRRRTTTTTSTTTTSTTEVPTVELRPNGVPLRSTTPQPTIIYATSIPKTAPNVPFILRSTTAAPLERQKLISEGQIIRPIQIDSVTSKPAILVTRAPILESSTIKPIVEEEEAANEKVRSNLLRRQLGPDARQHILNYKQSAGEDTADVYSASLTSGTPRPLFTTTARTLVPTASTRRILPVTYNKIVDRSKDGVTQESTTETTVTESFRNPTAVPVVQIPANRELPETAIPLKHPFHRGAILVPVSHLRARGYQLAPEYDPNYVHHYAVNNDQFVRRPIPTAIPSALPQASPTPIPLIVRRLRPVPIPVEENDFNQQTYTTTPYTVPITPSPYPRYMPEEYVQQEIDSISPPVSTRDFQKLLQYLMVRQEQLRIAKNVNLVPGDYYRGAYRGNGPVQFTPVPQVQRPRPFISLPHAQDMYQQDLYPNPSYVSNKRVARLQPQDEDYLPPDVREMLLLRMLQLAINPDLPLQPAENEVAANMPQHRKEPVRNVQIIGEEEDKLARSKRYRDMEGSMQYY